MLENFLSSASLYLMMVVTSKYAIEQLGASQALAGWAGGIFIVGGLIVRPFCGHSMDRLGRKRMLLLGVLASLCATALYPVVHGVQPLLIVRLLHGIASGITTTAAATIVAGIVPSDRWGEGIGYYSLGQTLATATGPFLGVFLSRDGTYGGVFIVALVTATLGVALVPLLSVEDAGHSLAQRPRSATRPRLDGLVESSVVPISLVCMVVSTCYSSVVAFLAVYSAEIDLSVAGSLFFLAYSVAVFVARPLAGRRLDQRGDNAIMYPALVAFAVALALLSQANSGVALIASALFLGCGSGVVRSGGQAIALSVATVQRAAPATATFLTIMDIGMSVGPTLAGALVSVAGYRGMYAVASILASGNVLLYYVLHGRRVRV